MKMKVYLTIAVLLIAGNAEAAGPQVFNESVETMLDPFRYGSSIYSDFHLVDSPDETSLDAYFQFNYGWSTGAGIDVIVPVVLWDTNPTTPGATTPRIGGTGYNQIEIDGNFRFWGNPSDYFGLTLGLALPFQSDDALIGTGNNDWEIPLIAQFRFTLWDAIAFVGLAEEEWNSPVILNNANGNSYSMFTNTLVLKGTISFFPKSLISPFFEWGDTWPNEHDIGLDSGGASLLEREIIASEGRNFFLGVNFIHFRTPLMVVLQANYKYLPQKAYPTSYLGAFKWAF